MMPRILYEDNHLIAVYKPAGVLVQAGEGGRHDNDTLYWRLKTFIKKRDKKPGDVFLGVLHRLDRPVSGIVLFAKTSKGAARLSKQFRNRTVKKFYHAMVEGRVEPVSGRLIHRLAKDQDIRVSKVSDEGDPAELSYETVKSNGKFSLLKIELKTGKFHQIRAQLAAIGHPIVGDIKYGAKRQASPHFLQIPASEIALVATELEFKTATADRLVSVKIDYPREWLR